MTDDREFIGAFRSVAGLPGRQSRPWWLAHPPRYAGAEFAAEVRARFAVAVEVRESEKLTASDG